MFVELLGRFPDSDRSGGRDGAGGGQARLRHARRPTSTRRWIGTDADALFTKATGRDVHVVNDADAAGLAEVRFGAAKGRETWSS